MWPWEHLAVGYLIYSLGSRALGRDPPTDGGVVALGIATQFPDLIDKPLSWGLGWVPTGYAVGHSVFVAVPLSLLVLAGARRIGRLRPSGAVLVGYWSHLVADVVNPLRSGGPPLFDRVLWPVADGVPYENDYGLGRGLVYLDRFAAELAATDLATILLLYLLVPLATLVLWVLDGAPGTALVGRAADAARRRL